MLFANTGCGPTYPETRVKESIIKVCKKEYNVDVKVETIGRTIAIYLPLTELIDFTFAITKGASEHINDVILSVSRVALSTDAKFDFYCIIAHDVRIPEIQIVIIKSVDDVKRFLLNDISRGEYSKRMLVDIRLSPQAQKERTIKEIFKKMNLDEKWQEQVMNDFFRSEPTALGDIGYWDGHFYIKDISLSEFLAEQIANRVRIEFKEDKSLSENLLLKTSKGSYLFKDSDRYFEFEVSAPPNRLLDEARDKDLQDKIVRMVLKVAYHVLHGYKFEDFDYLLVVDLQNGRSTMVEKKDLKNFMSKNAKLEDVMTLDAY